MNEFPNLRTCTDVNYMISVDNIQILTDHLLRQYKDMQSKFQDLRELQTSNWISDAF
jgi:ribosomal protein S15P/S13E